MAEDWSIDVKKYVPDADDKVIATIVRYCGIALQNRDSSLVSFTDVKETDRVRENYLKKKLALTDPDPVLDSAIAKVGERMKEDKTRNRVTVYYLLAEAFGKLGLFGAVDAVAPAVAPVAAAVAAPVASIAPVVAAVAAAPLMAAAIPAPRKEADQDVKTAFGAFGVMAALIAAMAVIGTLIGIRANRTHVETPVVEATTTVATTTVAAPVEAVPDGSGITTQEVEGKPQVSVYFDTAKTDIYPNFDARTEDVRKYVTDHAGSHLQVSGFNDPRGNAAFNAELSKNRAIAVRDALVKLGVPTESIDLVKPADTTDDADSLARGRRVDITAVDAQ